jgi:hypothetical protein
MSDFVSKVLAGGLSAGIFLLWWPAHITAQGAEWLIVRGLLWTLAFEILLLAFCPLERMIGAAFRARAVRVATPRRVAGALALATAGLAVPFGLLQGVQAQVAQPARTTAPTKVVVKREIVRREVVVRRVSHVVPVPVAPTAPHGASAAVPAAVRTATTSARRPAAATKPAAKRAATTSTAVSTSETSRPTQTEPVPAAKTPAATAAPAPAALQPAAGTTAAPAAAPATAAATPGASTGPTPAP